MNNYKGRDFEIFIGTLLENLGIDFIKTDLQFMISSAYDFVFPKGFPGVFEGECYGEVKYFSKPTSIREYIEKSHNVKLVFFTNLPVENIKYNSKNVKVLGLEYLEDIKKKYPKIWWNVTAAFSNSPEVGVKGDKVYIKEDNVASFFSNQQDILQSELEYKELKELTKINVELFKRDFAQNEKRSIIIGNGVSIPFGSDSWGSVSNYIFDYLSPKYVDNQNSVRNVIGNSYLACTSISKALIDVKKYYEALHSCIYRKYEKSMHVDGTLINEIVKSKVSHPDLNIYTYNYDNFVETEYKRVTSSKITPVANPSADKKYSEPKIRHIHGYLPYKSPSKHSNIILTQEEYFSKYSGKSWVVTSQEDALSGLCLYVGSSMSDVYQMSIINKIKNKKKYFRCYCLMCLKGLSDKDIAAVYNYYIRNGIYLIFVDDYSKLPSTYAQLF